MEIIWGFWNVLVALGVPLGLAGAWLTWWPIWRDRVHVKRIYDADDPDLVAIWDLQNSYFDPEVVDNLEDLQQWVRDNARGNGRDDEHRQTFVVLALKAKNTVCGFLYAQYFEKQATGFLGYLFVDKTQVEALGLVASGATMLLKAMIGAFNKTGSPWKYVVTEVQESPSEKDLSAAAKLKLFQTAARKLSIQAKREVVDVFKLPVNYRQPPLDLTRLKRPQDHTDPQWLLCAPRDKSMMTEREGTHYISREELTGILETLLLYCYGDNYPDNADYMTFLRGELKRYVRAMEQWMPVIRNPRKT
jgi:hypothetical protein